MSFLPVKIHPKASVDLAHVRCSGCLLQGWMSAGPSGTDPSHSHLLCIMSFSPQTLVCTKYSVPTPKSSVLGSGPLHTVYPPLAPPRGRACLTPPGQTLFSAPQHLCSFSRALAILCCDCLFPVHLFCCKPFKGLILG